MMKDIEVKLNGFRFKKLLALTACACMALGVVSIPVQANEVVINVAEAYTGDAGYDSSKGESAILSSIIDTRFKVVGSERETNGIDYQIYNGLIQYFNNNDTNAEQIAKLKEKIDATHAFMKVQSIRLSFNGYNIDKMDEYTKYLNDIMQVVGMKFTYDDVKSTTTIVGVDGLETTNGRRDDRKQPITAATSDPKDPSKVIDLIKNTDRPSVNVPVVQGSASLSKGIFETAKEANKKIEVSLYDEKGVSYADFSFNEGIKNPVEVNFGLKQIVNEGIVKDLENAVAFDFAHSGVLPGPMTVRLRVEAYKDIKEETTMFLYLLDEKTGELVKQEQVAKVQYGYVTFTIDHCSAYVTTIKDLTPEEVKVADPVVTPDEVTPDNKTPETDTTTKTPETVTPKEEIVKNGGNNGETNQGFKTIALITLCGAAIYIVTRKEKAKN